MTAARMHTGQTTDRRPQDRAVTEKPSWAVAEGDEVVPGRSVVTHLGGGRRTEVYHCTELATGDPVVVKILRPGREDASDRRVLAREAEALGQLDHPGFPRLIDADLDSERAWIAIEYVAGPHLSTLLRRFGSLEPEQSQALAHDIGASLAVLHSNDLVHLDVKPRNIVMGATPVLLDLGTARSTAAAARLRPGIGTRSTMSPEQADPARFGTVGPPADVFGLGVTLLIATGGTNPYRARREGDIDEVAAQRAAVAVTRTLDTPLATTIARCLALDPSERPTAAEVAAAAARAPVANRGSLLGRLARAVRGPARG